MLEKIYFSSEKILISDFDDELVHFGQPEFFEVLFEIWVSYEWFKLHLNQYFLWLNAATSSGLLGMFFS